MTTHCSPARGGVGCGSSSAVVVGGGHRVREARAPGGVKATANRPTDLGGGPAAVDGRSPAVAASPGPSRSALACCAACVPLWAFAVRRCPWPITCVRPVLLCWSLSFRFRNRKSAYPFITATPEGPAHRTHVCSVPPGHPEGGLPGSLLLKSQAGSPPPPPPPLSKARPCPSHSGRRDRINLGLI